MPWHRDPYRRVAVILKGDVLAIEYREGSQRNGLRYSRVRWSGRNRALTFTAP